MTTKIRKVLEKAGKRAAIGGVAVCAGWLAYKTYRYLTKKEEPPVIVFNPFKEECDVDGSVETPRLEPKCQVKLGHEHEGRIEVFGSGFRVNVGGLDYLATAGHNVAFGRGLYLVKGANIVYLDDLKITQTAYDSCLVAVDAKHWSALGASVARFAPVGNADLYVELVGASGKGTSGRLKTSTTHLGMVEYEATTSGGYSGSVYCNGNTVYGMHTLGGRANRGIAAMFLLHAFKIALRITEEAYDRAFYNRIMKQRTGHGNVVFLEDYAVVETQMGYFYRFPIKEFRKYEQEKIEEEHPEYRDDESEYSAGDFMEPGDKLENIYGVPLNSLRPGTSRAGKSYNQEPAFSNRERQLLKMLLQQRPYVPNWQKVRKSRKESAKDSVPQTPAAQPSTPASSSTQNAA